VTKLFGSGIKQHDNSTRQQILRLVLFEWRDSADAAPAKTPTVAMDATARARRKARKSAQTRRL
jgi:hypothetical protein